MDKNIESCARYVHIRLLSCIPFLMTFEVLQKSLYSIVVRCSIAIILMGKRELVALLNLSS